MKPQKIKSFAPDYRQLKELDYHLDSFGGVHFWRGVNGEIRAFPTKNALHPKKHGVFSTPKEAILTVFKGKNKGD